MALPGDLSTVQVTGTYKDAAGVPLAGTITFTPSALLADSTGSTVIPAYGKTYTLSGGQFTTDLLVATDNGDISPAGWTYLVSVAIQNLPPISFSVLIPHTPSPVDISALTPTATASVIAAISAFTVTPVKTANYTALPGQLVPCSTSSGSFTVTLPTTPASGCLVCVKQVAVAGAGTNAVTVACGGSDVFNVSGGVATATLTLKGQALLLEYGPGIWTVVATDDAATSLANMRQGVYYLDSFTGTDDAKMASALTAVIAAGGGTIILSPRAHSFANQWSTPYVSLTAITTLRIIGAGASGPGNTAATASGATKVTFTYSGAGAGQADFQHNGLLEIAGIWFNDTVNAVPFIFTTCPNPYIHDNAFTGPGSRLTCTKDAIVLGGAGIGEVGNAGTLGDLSKFSGYASARITGNYFDTIRRCVVFGGGANGISVTQNTVSSLCGDGSINFSAPFYFNGNSTHGNSGNFIAGNYVEMTQYQAVTTTNGSAGANENTIGPNGLWDANNTIGSYWDVTCAGNVFIDQSWRTAGSTTAIVDLNGGNAVVGGGPSARSVFKADVIIDGAVNLVVRNQGGRAAWAEGYAGQRAGMGTTTNGSGQAIAQVMAQAAATVANGTCFTASPYVVSATAAWTTSHVGSFISSVPASAGVPLNNRIIQVITPSSTVGFTWMPSTAYALGQVITPPTVNSHLYQVTTAGTSGSSAPVFPTGGGTVTDGTAVLTDLGTAATAVLCTQVATATAAGVTLSYVNPSATPALMTMFNNHHIIGTGTAPSYALGVAAQVGTGSPSVAAPGNDLGHIVTLVTGASGSLSAGLLCTGTPGNSFSGVGQASAFSVTPCNAITSGLGLFATFAANKWNISCSNAAANGATYQFMVNMIG